LSSAGIPFPSFDCLYKIARHPDDLSASVPPCELAQGGLQSAPKPCYITFVPETPPMLTGNSLLTLVNELQAQEPPAMMNEIVRACGYEIEGKLKYTQFYTELLSAKGLLNQPKPADISEEYREQYSDREQYTELCENYGEDAVNAFLDIWEESDLHGFEDAYQGRYEDEADFAEQFTTDCYGLNVPSFVVIDWQATWDQGLCYDYEFVNGFVFVNAW